MHACRLIDLVALMFVLEWLHSSAWSSRRRNPRATATAHSITFSGLYEKFAKNGLASGSATHMRCGGCS